MKCRLLVSFLSCLSLSALGDSDIELGGKVTTFTNLQGHVYENVRLERGTLDGLIYSFTNTVGGGMVKYKDLSTEYLTSLNIPTNRIQIAEDREKVRAEQKAQYDATVRALALQRQEEEAVAASNALAQARTNVATKTASASKPAKTTVTKRVVRRW